MFRIVVKVRARERPFLKKLQITRVRIPRRPMAPPASRKRGGDTKRALRSVTVSSVDGPRVGVRDKGGGGGEVRKDGGRLNGRTWPGGRRTF